MKRFWVGLLVAVAVAFSAGRASAAPRGDFEQKIYDELADIDPDAVPIMQAADKARDAEKTDEAAKGYEEVLRRAPTYFHAKRRLCGVEVMRDAVADLEAPLGEMHEEAVSHWRPVRHRAEQAREIAHSSLRYETCGARLFGPEAAPRILGLRAEHDGDVLRRRLRAEQSAELHTGDPSHPEIRDDRARRRGEGELGAGRRVRSDVDHEPERHEARSEKSAAPVVRVDEDESLLRGARDHVTRP